MCSVRSRCFQFNPSFLPDMIIWVESTKQKTCSLVKQMSQRTSSPGIERCTFWEMGAASVFWFETIQKFLQAVGRAETAVCRARAQNPTTCRQQSSICSHRSTTHVSACMSTNSQKLLPILKRLPDLNTGGVFSFLQTPAPSSSWFSLLLSKAFRFLNGKHQLLFQLLVALVGWQIQSVEAGKWTLKNVF